MNPMVVMSAVFATAAAAPTYDNVAGVIAAAPAPVGYTGYAGVAGVAVAPAVAPAAINVPAPYTTAEVRGAPVVTHSQAAPVVSKQLHYGSKDFVSGHTSEILKPAIPDFRIAVPTALKGTQSVTAPIVKSVKEIHTVNEPVPVERPYNVPYDVPVIKEQIREIPVPVHVDAPYNVAVPTPVQGEPIINVRQGPAVVKHTHTNVGIQQVAHVAAVAQPAVAQVGYAAAAVAQPAVAQVGYAGAAVAQPALAQVGYAGAELVAAPGVAAYGAQIAPAGVAATYGAQIAPAAALNYGYGINAAPVAVAAEY